MTTKTTFRTAALVGVVSALAVPAVAAAHPSVYSTVAKVAVTPATSPPTFTDQTRYVIPNDGVVFALRETNGNSATSSDPWRRRGVISYAKAAGRTGAAIINSDAAESGAQPHATCHVPSLETDSAILSWQNDPFYAYVPFQRGNSGPGLKDDPAKWIPVVKSLTGVDLNAIPDTDAARQAACETTLGGVYSKADETQSTVASLSSALISDTQKATAAPLQTQIATFQDTLAAAQAKQAATDAQLAAATAQLGQAEVVKPLAAKLTKTSFTPAQIASSGVPVAVTGPAGQVVRVRATVSAAQARKHRLNSTILGSKSGTVGKDGTASITVKPSAAQGKKLKAVTKGSVPVTLELVVGTTKATVSR
jgi:hypothetical protein